MSTRRPTPKQVDLLRAVRDGKVHAAGGHGGSESHFLTYSNDWVAITAAVERLISRDWVGYPPGVEYHPSGGRTLVLTDAGARVLADAT